MGLPFINRSTAWTPRELFRGGVGGIWLDFSDPTKIYSDAGVTQIKSGDTIQQIYDKSGNNNTMSQGTAGSRPAWASAGYATFDGTADHLIRSSSLDQYNSTAGVSAFVLMTAPNQTATFVCCDGSSTDNNPVFCLIGSDSATNTTHSGFSRNSVPTTLLSNATDLQLNIFDNTKRRVGAVNNFATTLVTPYSNGVAAATVASSRSGTVATDLFVVGAIARATPASFATITALYQLIIVKKILSAREISDLDTWFRSK